MECKWWRSPNRTVLEVEPLKETVGFKSFCSALIVVLMRRKADALRNRVEDTLGQQTTQRGLSVVGPL
ncbi:hypothetical protein GBA52_004274 [Prunus armeniaca]|nr:hypothetical protein GBA52_004274 [Prunus armeniaca]